MRFGQNLLNDISEKILKCELPYEDTIIIGDNSIGKSLLLKLFLEKMEDNKLIYFIDAVNRTFDVTKITKKIEKPEYKLTVRNTRLDEAHFNLQDSFNCYGTMTERIEQIYSAFETELQDMFYELTNDKFEVLYGNALGEVKFGEKNGLLSSGYQAMVRLLLELLYFTQMGLGETCNQRAWVIIDEIDEFLSPRYAARIFGFFREKFPRLKFIVTTHSSDLVKTAKNANLIILDIEGYEVMDVNDYYTVSEVQTIFNRVFGELSMEEPSVEDVLRRLINNKINKAWSTKDEEILQELTKEQLSASQQLIYKQIVEW